MKKRACFICGTDTDIGKSIITAGLLRCMPEARAIKVVQTGSALIDQNVYQQAAPRSEVKTLKHFQLAASPHLAAKLESLVLNLDDLYLAIEAEVARPGLTLLETSGGICTPLNFEETFLDLMAGLDYPVVLVAANKVGAINQALLSIAALRQKQLIIAGLIFTQARHDLNPLIAADNADMIQHLGKLPVLASIPYIPSLQNPAPPDEAWDELASYLRNATKELLTDN